MNQARREEYRRQSTRLQEWNYSWPGWYYVTTVIKLREQILGSVVNSAMYLSPYGHIAEETWQRIPRRYRNTELDLYVVMPNHVHGIIIINDHSVGAIHESPLQEEKDYQDFMQRRKMTLSRIMGWFKMNTAKQINLLRGGVGFFVWQRGYYDHIIRNEADLLRIRTYIASNPLQWTIDEENPQHAHH